MSKYQSLPVYCLLWPAVAIVAFGSPLHATAGETPPWTVYNRGIGGQNSRQGRERFEKDVVALNPDCVFVYFGLNDTLNEPAFVPLDEFVANMAWMIDRSRRAGIEPVVATIHPVDEEPLLKRHQRASYGSEGPNGKILRYNEAIRNLAKEKQVALADFAAVVQEAKDGAMEPEKGNERSPLVAPDGVHLTAAGNLALARCFVNALGRKLHGAKTIVCLGDSVTYGAGVKGAGTVEGDTYPAVLRQWNRRGNDEH